MFRSAVRLCFEYLCNMLTPRFEISQDDEYIFLVIHAPFAKVSDTEFFIEDLEIRFFSTPYYLRLHLPKPVIEDARASVKYDVDRGSFTAKIPKLNTGENFEGLDMLTKLLTPPGETSARAPAVEVCQSQCGEANDKDDSISCSMTSPNELNDFCLAHNDSAGSRSPNGEFVSADPDRKDQQIIDGDREEEFQWYIEQSVHQEDQFVSRSTYGFAGQRSCVFTKLMSEFSEILDVRDPDKLTVQEKRALRLDHEAQHFSEDHYLADLFESDSISDLLNLKPWWVELDGRCCLNDDEKDRLLQLPKKQYIIDDELLASVYFSLVDIIFAYAYNQRLIEGEDNVESGWTVAKLSSTLSWLETFTCLQDVLVSCFRRALTFPLHRSWALCEKVLDDAQTLFKGGKLFLLKCLLDVHRCMIVSDPRYIFNDLYITDYCVWIQSADERRIQSIAKALADAKVTKKEVGLDLDELEAAAALVAGEESISMETITSRMNEMQLYNQKAVLDSDDDSADDKDDSDDGKDDSTNDSDDSADDNDDDKDSSDDEEEEDTDSDEEEGKEEKGTDNDEKKEEDTVNDEKSLKIKT